MEFVNIDAEQIYEAEGAENIQVQESSILAAPQEFLDALEELKFKRIKIKVDGLLLSDYNFSIEMIKRGARIYVVEFHHIIPKKHDELAGPESFKLLMKAIAEVYTASKDIDIPVIFQFVLDCSEPEYLKQAVEELSEMYPSQFEIIGNVTSMELKKAVDFAISKGIWIETDDPSLANHKK